MVIASGTRAGLAFTIERERGVTPAGIGTPVDNTAAEADGGAAGLSKFTRASGSWITDGFTKGQLVKVEGYADTNNNANWRVRSVTATDLVVEDPGDVIGDEIAGAGQLVRILLETFRTTSRALNPEKEELESEEVDTLTGQITDSRHGFNRMVGNPGFQFSRLDYDWLLYVALGGTWEAPTAVSGVDIGSNTSTKKFTRASGSFITDGYREGDIVVVAGFTGGDTGNNGNWRVLAVAALEITVYDPNNLMTTATAAAGRTIGLKGKRLDIDPNLFTLYVERQFLDVVQYQKFNGVAINEMPFTVNPRSIIGGSMGLLGMSGGAFTSSSESALAAVQKSSASPYAAFDGTLHVNGTLQAVITSLEWTLNRNRSLEAVIGSRFSPDVFEGDAVPTGTMVAMFENPTLFNLFYNETESDLFLKLDDPDGTNFCSIVFPRLKYNGGTMEPPQRGPIPISMPFKALAHSTYLTSMWVQMSHL